MTTIVEHLASIIPHGHKCDGCPKGDPHGIAGYTGPVFCHLLEEVMPNGEKECAINDDRWEDPPLPQLVTGHSSLVTS